jgi:hypothetical protein
VYVHEHACGNCRIPRDIRDQHIRKTKDGRWLAALSLTDYLRNLPKELRGGNREIRRRQCVTLGYEAWPLDVCGRANHAMSEELPFASVQNDFASRDLTEVASLDEKDITRPHGGEHAVPRDLQSQSTEPTQNFSSKFAFQRVLLAQRPVVQLPHETFLLCMHPPCVAWTLPHLSAEVSNTRSKRKAGFL